jgi:hypothetical protein
MPKIDSYKHLNEDSKLTMTIDMEDLVSKIASMNYGTHRFLSALVHELRKRRRILQEDCAERYPNHSPVEDSPLAKGIEDLLNAGLYN